MPSVIIFYSCSHRYHRCGISILISMPILLLYVGWASWWSKSNEHKTLALEEVKPSRTCRSNPTITMYRDFRRHALFRIFLPFCLWPFWYVGHGLFFIRWRFTNAWPHFDSFLVLVMYCLWVWCGLPSFDLKRVEADRKLLLRELFKTYRYHKDDVLEIKTMDLGIWKWNTMVMKEATRFDRRISFIKSTGLLKIGYTTSCF